MHTAHGQKGDVLEQRSLGPTPLLLMILLLKARWCVSSAKPSFGDILKLWITCAVTSGQWFLHKLVTTVLMTRSLPSLHLLHIKGLLLILVTKVLMTMFLPHLLLLPLHLLLPLLIKCLILMHGIYTALKAALRAAALRTRALEEGLHIRGVLVRGAAILVAMSLPVLMTILKTMHILVLMTTMLLLVLVTTMQTTTATRVLRRHRGLHVALKGKQQQESH